MTDFEKFLCNEPLKPELAEDIWFRIKTKGLTTKEELIERYGGKENEKDVKYALELLNLLKIIESTEKGLVITNLSNDINKLINIIPHNGFRLLVLNRLRILSGNPPAYNQQAHVLLTFQILSEQDIGIIHTDQEKIIDLINREWEKNKYVPKSSQGSITLNEQKFSYWKELSVFLGLIYPGPKLKQFVISISPKLSKDLAILFISSSDQIKKRSQAPLNDFIEFLEHNFFYLTKIKGRYITVNKVIEGMLLSLENLGIFNYGLDGESPIYELQMRRSTGAISTRVNNLKINKHSNEEEEYHDMSTLSIS
jgi:hypothetical protein